MILKYLLFLLNFFSEAYSNVASKIGCEWHFVFECCENEVRKRLKVQKITFFGPYTKMKKKERKKMHRMA